MAHERVDRSALHRAQRKHARVIAERARELRFALRGAGLSGEAGDQYDFAFRGLLGCDFENTLIQAGLADRKLRGVHAHGNPAAARIEVVARERALAPRV
jgi:hypothetical protein